MGRWTPSDRSYDRSKGAPVWLVQAVSRLRRRNDPEFFAEFKGYVEEHVDEICAENSARWLVSLADTYADYGTPLERSCALLITLLVNLEKIAQTAIAIRERRHPDLHRKRLAFRNLIRKLGKTRVRRMAAGLLEAARTNPPAGGSALRGLWGSLSKKLESHDDWVIFEGLSYLSLGEKADLVFNLFRRLFAAFDGTPALRTVFRAVVTRLLEHPTHTIRVIGAHHQRDLAGEILHLADHPCPEYFGALDELRERYRREVAPAVGGRKRGRPRS